MVVHTTAIGMYGLNSPICMPGRTAAWRGASEVTEAMLRDDSRYQDKGPVRLAADEFIKCALACTAIDPRPAAFPRAIVC